VRQEVFEFETQQRDGAAVVRLFGELDIAEAHVLQHELDRLRGGELSQLTIDLSELEFVDSTGLHLLMSLQGTCAREQVALTLVPGPPAVQRLFEVTGIDTHFCFISGEPAPTGRDGGVRSP
jgi:anti-anti-sigma factor